MGTSTERFCSVTKPTDRYVLQCVNAAVYGDIDLLMRQTRMVMNSCLPHLPLSLNIGCLS